MAQYAPEDPMVPKFDTESFESTDKMQKGSLLQSAMDAINDFSGIRSVETTNRMSPRNQLMKDAADSKEKESLLDVGTKNAYWLLPAAMAAIGGLTSKKKDKKRNAMLGFQAGVQPGSQAFKTYMMENQKQALGFAQEVLNDPNIPDNVKTDPKFLTSYVSTRMGDKKFDKPALSQQVNDQINQYFNIQSNVGQDRIAVGKELRLLNLQAFSQGQDLDIPNPAGRRYTSAYSVFTPEFFEDAFNDAFEKAKLPPLTTNNIGKGAEGYYAWRGLSPEQREVARQVMVDANIDRELIESVLPDDTSSQLKDEKARQQIVTAKIKAGMLQQKKEGKTIDPMKIFTTAFQVTKEAGGSMQDAINEVKSFLAGQDVDVLLPGAMSKEEARSFDRQFSTHLKNAWSILSENTWKASDFKDMPSFTAFKNTLNSEWSKKEADQVWESLRKSEDAARRAGIWRESVVGGGDGEQVEKDLDAILGKVVKLHQVEATGEFVEQRGNKFYYQGTDREYKP